MKIHYTLLLFLLSVITVKAQIIHIPADQPTIQAGIENAQDGDTILVEEGTYFENINFLGKPVTVASRFIMDGDTSHITKTIIDGSQSTHADTGSVVLMMTLEDTTSVLMGFTITRGTGSAISAIWGQNESEIDLIGGGVAIINAGGKVVHNIIEHNTLDGNGRSEFVMGGGIYANVSNNRTAIIRNNIIRGNMIVSNRNQTTGAGAGFVGGRFLIENNLFTENIASRPGGNANCGGFYWGSWSAPGVIREVIIRNNIITYNQCLGDGEYTWGGGAILVFQNGDNPVELYNNVIAHNFSGLSGGGLCIYQSNVNIINNTIFGNRATLSGNNMEIDQSSCRIINNIIWSDTLSEHAKNVEIKNYYQQAMYYNLFSEPFGPEDPFTGYGNVFLDMEFTDGSYAPPENSAAIGRGIDSMFIGSAWYTAPAKDINGIPRPGEADEYVDIGAFESPYPQTLLPNADLAIIKAEDHSLVPAFHKDSLNYLMVKEAGGELTDDWKILPEDNLATIVFDSAQDLTSENEQDRTTTILVTASDGTTQKEYIVVYKYLSSDTTLASLEVSEGFLEPDFDPLVSAYVDTLPHGVKIIPAVLVVASDTSARVMVDEAQYPESPWEIFRTTTITVTSANGLYTGKYSILFTMDLTQPEVILVHDSVEADGELGMILTEADHAYLVPENTPGVFDSIIAAQLAEMEAGIADTAYLSTSGVEPGTYWIYACDRHQSVSESQEVTIFEKEITSVNDLSAEKIKVYPSPVSQTLYVVSPHPLEQIELYNVIGMPVLKVKNPDGGIDVGHLPAGVYLLRLIMEENKAFTKRIIKK